MQPTLLLQIGECYSSAEVHNLLLRYGYPSISSASNNVSSFPITKYCSQGGHSFLQFDRTTTLTQECHRHICGLCLLPIEFECSSSTMSSTVLLLEKARRGPRHHELTFLDTLSPDRNTITVRLYHPALRPIIFKKQPAPLIKMIETLQKVLERLLVSNDDKFRKIKKTNEALSFGDGIGCNVLRTAGFIDKTLEENNQDVMLMLDKNVSHVRINQVLLELECAKIVTYMSHPNFDTIQTTNSREEMKNKSKVSKMEQLRLLPLPDDSVSALENSFKPIGNQQVQASQTLSSLNVSSRSATVPPSNDSNSTNNNNMLKAALLRQNNNLHINTLSGIASRKRPAEIDLTRESGATKRAKVDRHGVVVNLSYSLERRKVLHCNGNR